MTAPTIPTSIRPSRRRAGLALALAVGLVACGSSRTEPVDASPSMQEAMCVVTQPVREHLLHGASFTEIVERPPSDPAVEGTAAALALVLSRSTDDLGPYAPALDHLATIGRVGAERKGDLPTTTDAVVASARRLDEDLADGACTD